jgi:hypothetical protein
MYRASWRVKETIRMTRIALLALLLAASPALAQQQSQPMSTTALQQQRNLAFDLQAQAVAQIELLAQENAKLRARVQELEKLSSKKPDEHNGEDQTKQQ